MAGRPKREGEVEVVFLRLPKDLVERVTRCKGKILMQEGVNLNTTKAFCRILEEGCEALERRLEGRETRALVAMPETAMLAEIASIANGAPTAYDDMPAFLDDEDEEPLALPVDVPQTAETPSRKRSAWNKLPQETLQAIADEWTLCQGLSYSEFAQRLHEKGIYSATAKDGRKVPVSTGKVSEWLKRAEGQGLL